MTENPHNSDPSLERLLRQWGAFEAVEQTAVGPPPDVSRVERRRDRLLRWSPVAAAVVLLAGATVLYLQARAIREQVKRDQLARATQPEPTAGKAGSEDAKFRAAEPDVAVEVDPGGGLESSGRAGRGPRPAQAPPTALAEPSDAPTGEARGAGAAQGRPPTESADHIAVGEEETARAAASMARTRGRSEGDGTGDAGDVAGRFDSDLRGQAARRPLASARQTQGMVDGLSKRLETTQKKLHETEQRLEDAYEQNAELDRRAAEVESLRRQLGRVSKELNRLKETRTAGAPAARPEPMSEQLAARAPGAREGALDKAPAGPAAPSAAAKLAAKAASADAEGTERDRETDRAGDRAADQGRVLRVFSVGYRSALAPGETGLAAWQTVAARSRLAQRAAEVRKRAAGEATRILIDQVEFALLRLQLTDPDSPQQREALVGLVRRGELIAALDRLLLESDQSDSVYAWLLEARTVLKGAIDAT